MGLEFLIQKFLEDTTNEIFEAEVEPQNLDESVTHNKIFKHLSIALYQNKEVILDALKDTLKTLIGTKVGVGIDELVEILRRCVISPFKKSKTTNFQINSNQLRRILGTGLKFQLSDTQKAALHTLNSMYSKKEVVRILAFRNLFFKLKDLFEIKNLCYILIS